MSPLANANETTFPIISKILSNVTFRKMYVAHMKTILEENFENSLYETRALEIQDIIDADVQADPNKFFTYSNFVSNVYTQVGGGPQSVIGIVQLMDARADYLGSLAEFQYAAPEISSAGHSPEQVPANSEVWFTAEVNNASVVQLAARSGLKYPFEKKTMYDDGAHQDGAAGDGIFGASVIVGSTDIQYYIYAENNQACAFLPARAEYEFFEIEITGSLVINELMADNENTVADQDGDFDDWIELFNNGTENLALGGYYLSDDPSDPGQWAMPDTTIAAGGYLIIWADNDEEQSGLHANFKLSASGETLVLSDNNLNLLDQINFPAQKADTTIGRYENGTGDFIEMLPTFGAENTNFLTGIFNQWNTEVSGFTLDQNFPNPCTETTTIGFSLSTQAMVTLTVSNIHGKTMKTLVSETLPASEFRYQWNVNGVAPGIYLCTMRVNNQLIVKKMTVL